MFVVACFVMLEYFSYVVVLGFGTSEEVGETVCNRNARDAVWDRAPRLRRKMGKMRYERMLWSFSVHGSSVVQLVSSEVAEHLGSGTRSMETFWVNP
jgi:hypothetical protein